MTSIDSASACNCNQRSILDIIWSCLSTLFLCTWVSVHPNMPSPGDEWWKILWRRLKTMYWALMTPELVLTWAVRQLIGARKILNDYEHLHPDWSMKHVHYLQMGGFHLRNGESTVVLYPKQFHEHLEKKEILLPSITEDDIQDRSKADALSKIIVVFQTIWFVVQCIGRHTQGLALAQLEVATLAVISCTFILCIIWWDKPFDVRQPTYLNCTSDSSPQPTQGSDSPHATSSLKMNMKKIMVHTLKL
ncbi:hypothetical protein BDQ17DRAFT_1237610 [Cyathus striatus]|nr:hypothetical protein BDQ17DRAFT_1237610 [Cyathus striatus]